LDKSAETASQLNLKNIAYKNSRHAE